MKISDILCQKFLFDKRHINKKFKMTKSSPNASGSKQDNATTVELTAPDTQHGLTDLTAATSFDMADFEKRFEETQLETSRILRQSAAPEKPVETQQAITFNIPDATIPVSPQKLQKEPAKTPAESGLLARLAREAKENLDSKQSVDQDKQAKARRVHDALERIFVFLTPFIQHVNNIEHNIDRKYRLDARTEFANLQWQGATVDYRKLSLSESANLAYVVFNLKLYAPEPVLIKRPWDQFDALKKELHHLRLNVLDDLADLYRKPKQEWLQAQLDPVLQLQILFKGNYENNKIDIATRNIEQLGPAAFKLEPEDISPDFLDELGLFLIGRADKLPALLRQPS